MTPADQVATAIHISWKLRNWHDFSTLRQHRGGNLQFNLFYLFNLRHETCRQRFSTPATIGISTQIESWQGMNGPQLVRIDDRHTLEDIHRLFE